MSTKNRPSIFDYLDLSGYLQDYYQYRKNSDSKFSYESWAQELDVKNKSFLRLAVIGKKKISPKLLEALSENIFSSKNEKEYFYYLVKHTYAESQKDKQDFSNKLVRILKMNSQEELIENYTEFLATPLLPRLMTLVSFKDVRPVSATYARLLGCTEQETEELLRKLEKINLVKTEFVDGETHWLSVNDAFKVPDQIGSEAMLAFHKASLEDALKAFHQPKELRRYRSLFLAMSQEQVNEFYALLDDFASEQKIRYSSDSLKGKKLFQANFNIHVVSGEA